MSHPYTFQEMPLSSPSAVHLPLKVGFEKHGVTWLLICYHQKEQVSQVSPLNYKSSKDVKSPITAGNQNR